MLNIFNLDVHAVIGLLVWINIGLTFLLITKLNTSLQGENRREIIIFTWSRLLQALGWLLLFYRVEIPFVLSMYIGNTILFLGFLLEVHVFLMVINRINKVNTSIAGGITVAGILGFWLIPSTASSYVFVIVASIIALLIFLVPIISAFVTKLDSGYKIVVVIFYGLVILALVLRTLDAAVNSGRHLNHSSFVNALTFITFVEVAVVSTPAFLFEFSRKAELSLTRLASTDSLTGLINRRTLLHEMENKLLAHRDLDLPMSTLFIDIDLFKDINDEFGHDFGDFVLKDLASILRTATRDVDYPARYGGEEFIVYLPFTNKKGADIVTSRINDLIKQSEYNYTVSIGVCIKIPHDVTVKQMINKADEAMYQAKQTGRNRTVFCNQLEKK